LVLVSGTGFSISDAISPLVSSLAGQQFSCMAVLEIESIDVSLTAQSDVFTVSVQSKPVRENSNLILRLSVMDLPSPWETHIHFLYGNEL
jgi:hypothetical protein